MSKSPFDNPQFLYLVIPAEILKRRDIGLVAKLIVSKVASYPSEKGCFAGDDWFATLLNVSKRTIGRAIGQLKVAGLITITHKNKRDRLIKITDKMSAIIDKMREPLRTNCPTSKTEHSNTKNSNTRSNSYDRNRFNHSQRKTKEKTRNNPEPETNRYLNYTGTTIEV